MDGGKLLVLSLLGLMIGLGLLAAALATRAIWPTIGTELDGAVVTYTGFRRFLLGLINGFFLFIIAVICFQHGPLGLIGLLILFSMMLLAFLGWLAEINSLGQKILALRDLPSSLLAQTIAGGLTYSGLQLLPLVGVLIGILVLIRSLGTGVCWLVKRKSLVVSVVNKS